MLVILGGGTFSPIRNHLALCAPAFGNTARKLHEKLPGSKLYLTKMADSTSDLVTNEDVSKLIDTLLDDISVKTIILNIAFCDYKALPINNVISDFHAERLSTSNGNINIELTPYEKVIVKIKQKRNDICLVGFKTTTNHTFEQQILAGKKAMSQNNADIIFCNDTVTRNNVLVFKNTIVNTDSREDALNKLIKSLN
jgi:hypothetical protein